MGKRSNFKRLERDSYSTPGKAVLPLLPHLRPHTIFHEPCFGAGALSSSLGTHGHEMARGTDIEGGVDVFSLTSCVGHIFITNPPWPALGQHGDPTVGMALHLSGIAPTWLLLSSDFAHNKYFSKLADRCHKIVSVGRVKWIEGSKGPGKDNCAWYLFDIVPHGGTLFYGRTE